MNVPLDHMRPYKIDYLIIIRKVRKNWRVGRLFYFIFCFFCCNFVYIIEKKEEELQEENGWWKKNIFMKSES